MKTLVVVDYQFDFYDPAGTLHVERGEEFGERIAAVMPEYDNIVFTLDWHPADHCSFVENGGPWPEHCVQYTPGAGIAPLLVKTAVKLGKNVTLYKKGYVASFEEYGAFAELTDAEQQRCIEGTAPKEYFEASEEIDVCGLAAGFCVDNTVLNLIAAGYGPKVAILADCTGKLCSEEAFQTFVAEHDIRVI